MYFSISQLAIIFEINIIVILVCILFIINVSMPIPCGKEIFTIVCQCYDLCVIFVEALFTFIHNSSVWPISEQWFIKLHKTFYFIFQSFMKGVIHQNIQLEYYGLLQFSPVLLPFLLLLLTRGHSNMWDNPCLLF